MNFQLKFNMDNAAFDNLPATTISDILKEVSSQVLIGYTEGIIKDINGNTIGNWGVVE